MIYWVSVFQCAFLFTVYLLYFLHITLSLIQCKNSKEEHLLSLRKYYQNNPFYYTSSIPNGNTISHKTHLNTELLQ